MFDWEHGIALHPMQGIQASSPAEGGCLMGFLELRQEPGIYTRVTAGMAIRNTTLFCKVRTPIVFELTPQESKLGLAG